MEAFSVGEGEGNIIIPQVLFVVVFSINLYGLAYVFFRLAEEGEGGGCVGGILGEEALGFANVSVTSSRAFIVTDLLV
ncbi:MAG: hypothetical protein RIE73_37575 [Coleofasciculus sp. C1-SOL-03]|uniref:hypothetical protein n=1 Tax=Coleofasciculus sp. C1-SOL-03 TaxID=3069522 RepID=UPI003302794B